MIWHLRTASFLAIFLLLACGLESASKSDAPPAIKRLVQNRLVELDQHIADLLLKRADAAAPLRPLLDMDVDFRILSRWLLLQASGAPAGSEVECAAILRNRLLERAASEARELIQAQEGKLKRGQSDGLTRLHQLTFDLPQGRSVKELDDTCRKVGIIALLLTGPSPEAERTPPQMRPRPIRGGSSANATPNRTRDPQRSVADLTAAVARLKVSPPLQRQLSALAMAASSAGRDHAALQKMLETSVDIATGLESNIGVSPEARAQMEEQLTQAIVLFMDPRLRPAGQAKAASLHQYRQVIARIAALKLSPEQTAQYAPLFTLARQNPDAANPALAALDRVLQERSRSAARQKQRANVTPAIQKSLEEIEKQSLAASASFAAAASAADVQAMEAQSLEIKRLNDLAEKLDGIPAAIEELNAFKPKPTGGLERRITSAINAVSSNGPQRAEAVRFLESIEQLASVGRQLGQMRVDLPAPIEKRYTDGKLPALDTRWRAIVGDLASAAASGRDIDQRKLTHLQNVVGLYEGLKGAASLEADVAATEPLRKWVDWGLGSAELRPIIDAYATAFQQAIGGFVGDTPAAVDHLAATQERYEPLLRFVHRLAGYREQCESLPAGLLGSAAALMTPLEGAPFALERRIACAMWAFRAAPSDEVLQHVLKQLP